MRAVVPDRELSREEVLHVVRAAAINNARAKKDLDETVKWAKRLGATTREILAALDVE